MKFLPVVSFSAGALAHGSARIRVGRRFPWTRIVAGFVGLMLSGAFLTQAVAEPEQPNLFVNGSFEKGMEGWEVHPKSPQTTAALDPEQRHDGHPSVRLENTAAKASGLFQVVSVKPATRYRLSGWIKAGKILKGEGEKDGEIGAGLGVIMWWDHSNWVSDSKDWVQVSMVLNTSQKDTELKIGPWLGHYGHQATGTAWFADLSLVELGPVPGAENATPSAPVAGSSPQPGNGSFVPLLDAAHTDGWKYAGDGEMTVHDGIATTSTKDGVYWYEKSSFADFTLKLEFKADSMEANSGVFLRFPDPGNNYRMVAEKGCEIDIFGKRTGSIVFPGDTIRPSSPLPFLLGAWNEFEIKVTGQKFTVMLNGQVVSEMSGRGSLDGYVGLQTNKGDGPVQFRNVRIKTAPAAPAAPAPQNLAGMPWQNASWTSDVSLAAGSYDGTGKKIEVIKDLKVNVAPSCLVQGGSFNSASGVVWTAQESVFWGNRFEDNMGAKFTATSCLFDSVVMNKTGGWFVDRWSTHWVFENCIFAGKFMQSELGITDYSVRANRCTFRNLTLPKLKYKKDPAEEAQSNDLQFSHCHFIRCEVPESFLASTVDCLFEECDFSGPRTDWAKAGKPIPVAAYVAGPGEAPASYENGNLKVTFKTAAPPDSGSTVAYAFTNGYLSLPTINPQGPKLALGAGETKLALAGSSQPAPATNLLQDATMEQRTKNWRMQTFGKKDVVVRDENQPHNGHASTRIEQTGSADRCETVQNVEVKPDTRYRLSGWIKTENLVQPEGEKPKPGEVGACLMIIPSFTRTPVVLGTNDWTYVTLDFSSDKKTNLQVLTEFWGHVTGTAWFADLSLVELGSGEIASNSPTTPAFTSPTASTPATTAELVKKYRNSLVFVTGTNGSGSGFLAKYETGNFLFTNAHVAAGVKGASFKTLDGTQLKLGAASCAVGHDVFLIQATSSGEPFEIMKGVDENAAIGDKVVVLGNAEGAGVINTITGKIVGVGPNLVEVDAPFLPGNSGSPIIHLKSGKVIGVATYAVIRKYDPATKQPIKDPVIRRFGYRLDSIKSWQPVNWAAFSAQAAEMESIEKLTTDLAAIIDDLARNSHITRGAHNNPAFKNRIDAWLEDRSKRLSPRDAAMADQSFLSFLKITCQSDVAAARQNLTYDYFQRGLVDQQRERDEIAKVFDEIIQGLRKEN